MEVNKILQGDCIEEMKKLPENSIDAIITDPPYGLEFMGKEWDRFGISEGRAKRLTGIDAKDRPDRFFNYREGSEKRGRYTEMNVREKTSMQLFMQHWATECLRVLKPGGFLLSFGGTRTYHRLVCGIEDAGFEIRDTIMWLYGSGFPKSLDIGQSFDRQECRKQLTEKLGRKPTKDEFKKVWEDFRKVVGKNENARTNLPEKDIYEAGIRGKECNITEPVTPEAKEWEGWGTALKPSNEPIVVARKPLSEKNVALNVLKWETGGINIDECRVEGITSGSGANMSNKVYGDYKDKRVGVPNVVNTQGRFPANIILDEEAGKMLDEQSGDVSQGHWSKTITKGFGEFGGGSSEYFGVGEKDKTKHGASRFFHCAKASKSERNYGCEELEAKNQYEINKWTENDYRKGDGEKTTEPKKNNHPTVKPIALMEYLIKLISKEGAIVLDPFLGSGTTAIACLKLNRNFIGIEKEEEYVKIANARIKPFLEQRKLK